MNIHSAHIRLGWVLSCSLLLLLTSLAAVMPISTGDSLRPPISPSSPASASSGRTTRISVTTDGSQANNSSFIATVSDDDRYVAFMSNASNLVANDSNPYWDCFVQDRQTGRISRVSLAFDGTQPNAWCARPAISGSGRFVAFESFSSNLVPGDTNGRSDVFVYDRQTNQTERVSIASDGTQGNAESTAPQLSHDGRFVAFYSTASNLVAGDTNGGYDVFTHDRQTGQTTLVSVASNGAQGHGSSDYSPTWSPAISDDGRFVAFSSDASDLVAGDTNGLDDVFVHDRQTGLTTRVSIASNGSQANGLSSGSPAISGDGRFVAFNSSASNLVMNDTNGANDVFVHDRQTGQTIRVSSASDGMQGNNSSYIDSAASMSADGGRVAFSSSASNLVAQDTNGKSDIFVHDLQLGLTERVSITSDGVQANDASYRPAVSGDGSLVVFESFASNLVANDSNGFQDVFGHVGETIQHIEVTQATQDMYNEVPLIAGKPTFARVYVDCFQNCDSLASTASLRVTGPSGALGFAQGPQRGFVYAAGYDAQRADLRRTLNFALPAAWATGDVTLEAQVGGLKRSIDVSFQEASTLVVAQIPIDYHPPLIPCIGISGRPSQERIAVAHEWAQKVLPTARIVTSILPPMRWTDGLCYVTQAGRNRLWNALMSDYRMYSMPSTHVFGWLPDEAMLNSNGESRPIWDGTQYIGDVAFAEDDPYESPRLFAHELGHMLGRRHTNTGQCGDYDPLPDWPSDWKTSDIHEYGLDGQRPGWADSSAGALKQPFGTYDYMSYCGNLRSDNVWTSAFNYERVYYDTLTAERLSVASPSFSDSSRQFIASGLVYSDDVAVLDPIWVITATSQSLNPPVGTGYCLEAQDDDGTSLAGHCFDLAFRSFEGDQTSNVDGFNIILPYPDGVHRVVLRKGAQELAQQLVSPDAPTVTVLSPNGGEVWGSTGIYTITWAAADADGDTLTYSILYSPDGSEWLPVGTAITETQYSISAADLPGSTGARIRVLASDGINTAADESDNPFTVKAKRPSAAILTPDEPITSTTSTSNLLQGYAYDLEDGTLQGPSAHWTSDLDGDLGEGDEITTFLSPGQHMITFTATDSDNNAAEAFLNILVREPLPPIAPTLGISMTSAAVHLAWSYIAEDANSNEVNITHYEIWRSRQPYFAPYDDGAFLIAEVEVPDGASAGDPLSYSDTDVIAAGSVSYYYLLRAVTADGLLSDGSNRSGLFRSGLLPGGN